MQEKLGLPQNNRKPRTQIAERKQRRQDARRGGSLHTNKRRKLDHVESDEVVEEIEQEVEDEEGDDFDEDDDAPVADIEHPAPISRHRNPISNVGRVDKPLSYDVAGEYEVSFVPEDEGSEAWDKLSRGSREYSPEVVLDASSNTFKNRQIEDDAEILALEKKLGMKEKKGKKATDDDFDGLLEGIEESSEDTRQSRQDKDWLARKQARAEFKQLEPQNQYEGEEADSIGSDLEGDVSDADDDFEGFDDENQDPEHEAMIKQQAPSTRPARENPYVAPVTTSSDAATAKYIPPSRRKPPDTDTEKLQKLQRQAQGSLNKLSEANIISIIDEFDKLYQNNPRQDVSTVLIDMLLAAFSSRSSLQNTYIILHAAFIAGLYKILGADFGAEIISRLIDAFDKHHSDPAIDGKESLNLISLLANLFTFSVVSSALVYDHIRLLLSDFGENSAELLLRIIRDCGPQLRQDDPTALKGIVRMMNDISASMTSTGQTINIRTRVMMDTITDLKNNKTRQATNAAGVTGEHLTRMRKALGSLNSRQLRGTEPLGITRNDILNSDKKGKWWLVGASWKGRDLLQAPSARQSTNRDVALDAPSDDSDIDPDTLDYQSLARHHNLTTPTQRAIFTAILSATDSTDALARLSKLRLNRKQEPEIPRVLLRLCRAETSYNQYYSVLSRLLLRDGRRYRFAFEVALWKFFEEIGERGTLDDEGSEDEGMGMGGGREVHVHEIANTARLFASLVAKQSLTLDILKTLNIAFLKENAAVWLEMFFIALFSQPKIDEQKLVGLISGIKLDMARSVTYFLQKTVKKSDLVEENERKKVKKGVRMAVAALDALERGEEEEFEL